MASILCMKRKIDDLNIEKLNGHARRCAHAQKTLMLCIAASQIELTRNLGLNVFSRWEVLLTVKNIFRILPV